MSRRKNDPPREADHSTGHVTVVCGTSLLRSKMMPEVDLGVAAAVRAGARELRFVGAGGANTAALGAAGALEASGPRLTVIVPHTVEDRPAEARAVMAAHAHEVRELGLPQSGELLQQYHRAVLKGAQRLLAFIDGFNPRAMVDIVHKALWLGMELDLVEVGTVRQRSRHPKVTAGVPRQPGARRDRARRPPPKPKLEGIFAGERYVSTLEGPGHEMSARLRRHAAGLASEQDVEILVDALSSLMSEHDLLREAQAIAAVPGRRPGEAGPMAAVARELARRTGKEALDGWIVHAADPKRRYRAYGIPTDAEAHARALRVVGPSPGKVMVLDAVWPVGGSLEGAMLAVERDTGTLPAGLAVMRVAAARRRHDRRRRRPWPQRGRRKA